MATAEQYANWIVQNQDKKGTPEFETVAEAYKLVRYGGGSQAQPAPQKSSMPSLNLGALKDTTMDVLSGKYGRDAIRSALYGGLDLAQGAGQLVSNVVDPVMPGTAASFNQAMKDTERQYQEGRYSPNVPDVGRVTGNVLTGLAAAPSSQAPSLIGRMKQSGGLATVLGAAAPVNPDDPNYGGSKTAQIALSGAMGFAAPAVVEPIVKGVGTVANFLARQGQGAINRITGQASPSVIENTLKVELERGGVDWNKLSQEYRNSLIYEVQNAVKAGGTVSQEAVRRLADFEKVGIKPLSGQLSRDPAQFAREQNLARTEVGAPIAQRLGEQNAGLISAVQSVRPPSAGADPYAAGQRVIAGLQAKDAPVRSSVDRAYQAARDDIGRAAPMDAYAFSTKANLALDEGMLGAYLPAEVRTILNGISEGKIPFNVNTAVQIDSTLSAAQRTAGARSPQALAIGKVRDALNSAPIENAAGEGAKAAFDAARAKAASRFANIERTPALKAVIEGDASPDKFVEQFAIRGKVQDVANLMRNIPVESRAEVRAGVLDFIKSKAVIGEGDTAKFTQAGLRKALDAIGDRKLELIFAGDRGSLEMLRAASRAGAAVQVPPVASGVNYSGSGTTILDAVDRASRLPVIGALMGKPSDIVRATQVSRSLAAPVPVNPSAPLLSDELLRQIGTRGGALSAPIIGGGLLGVYR